MKKKIKTANETITGMTFPIVFTLILAGLFLYQCLKGDFKESYLFVFLLGLLLPIQSLKIVRTSMKYRQLHQHFLKEYRPQKGIITNITKELPTEENRKYDKICYFLHIDVVNAGGNVVRKVKSDAYYIPIHQYLASPEVDVYYDNQLKYCVVDGFHLKENENDPDIPLENTNVYEELKMPKREVAPVVKYIWIGGSIFIAIQIILAFVWK